MKSKVIITTKKLIAVLLTLLIISSVLPSFTVKTSAAEITATTPNKDGNGVYQIGTSAELYWFADKVNNDNANYGSAKAVLTADIVVNTGVLKADGTLNSGTFTNWTPIGNYDNKYIGTFDGQGHTISGLYFNDTSKDYVGLFGFLGSDGEIKNVGVIDSYFRGNSYVGGVCGRNYNSTITGCYNTGTVSGNSRVGGVCGYNASNGTITGCYNTGTVSGIQNVGGVCGYNASNGTITGCYNTGTVSGNYYVGGVCGYNYNGTITGCYNTSTVSGASCIGGVCGYNRSGTITGCYTNNKGICGYNDGGTISSDCAEYKGNEFKDGTVCTLLNTALKNENASVRFYQVANYPKLCVIPKSVDGVYQIGTAAELYGFAQLVNSGTTNANAVLTADIVVNTGVLKANGTLNSGTFTSWTPIENSSNQYTGTFDGQGHTISGLYFNNTDTSYVGLFGRLGSGGKIKNVGVIDSYFRGKYYVGGVCGLNEGTITGCYNTGTVIGSDSVGGVCGRNSTNGTITGCYNTGTVIGSISYIVVTYTTYVGGVCGTNFGTAIGCYSTDKVGGGSSKSKVGGVCGMNYATVIGCYTNRSGDTYYRHDLQFADGTVCGLLNTALKMQSSEILFCQRIGTDVLPLLTYQFKSIDEHTYKVYKVDNNTFKATCLCGEKSKTMELTLKTEKAVVVNGADNTLTATLSNYENEAVTYKWYQNDVEIQNATSSTYNMPTNLSTGTYTYRVEVTMAGVGTITQSVDVVVIIQSYTVTIPETVTLGGTATIKAENVVLKKNKQLEVTITGTSGDNNAFAIKSAEGAVLEYTVTKADGTKVSLNDKVLTVNPDNTDTDSTTLKFNTPGKAKFSGEYKGTVTFNVSIN